MRRGVSGSAGLVGVALGLVVILLAPRPVRAQGGPPLLTDDPDTPGPGYWEINVSAFLETTRRERSWETPRLDLNYGVGRRIQLKLEAPWLGAREVGSAVRTGPGDVATGVKWRFLGQEGKTLAWSVYPQVEFNADHASVAKGLVEGGGQVLLPTEITLELAHVEINGEIGRSFAGEGASEWLYGISTEAEITRRLELVGELHGERPDSEPTELIVNVGARQKVTRRLILMLAAGRAVRGLPEERPHLLAYAGLQLNLPGLYRFDQPQDARQASVR
jgi:hypothetical protein